MTTIPEAAAPRFRLDAAWPIGKRAANRVVSLAASLAVCATTAGAAASGETIIVTAGLDDIADFGGAQQVADLPGPDGVVTLREAVFAANNTAGPQTIAFAIPASGWWWLFADRATVLLENPLHLTDDDTTIDFGTQRALTGDTNPAGNEVALYYLGPPAAVPSVWIFSSGCTIRGLDAGLGNNFGNTIWITGNANRVVGCTTNGLTIRGDYGGGDGNTIGGSAPGDGNSFSEAVSIQSAANGNAVVGNRIQWGIRIHGDPSGATADGNRIGGLAAGERNVISGRGSFTTEGVPSGVQVEVLHARGTVIEGNFIGTTADGMARVTGHSGAGGISVSAGAVDTVVRGNVVSGFDMTGVGHALGQRFGTAIGVGSNASGTSVVGNLVGLAVDGMTPILNVEGIVVSSDATGVPVGTRIGGDGIGEGNSIATGERAGVRVLYGATGVRISRNAIFVNGGLGIDLAGTAPLGVTPNDPLDTDTGGNGLQNFPQLLSARPLAGGCEVAGALLSAPNHEYVLEFFASADCDASGHGEGRRFLGSRTVTTNAKGRAEFVAACDGRLLAGESVSATATSVAAAPGAAAWSTSEFSACIAAEPALTGCDADLNADARVDAADLTALLAAWGTAAADLDGSGATDAADLAALLVSWGPC